VPRLLDLHEVARRAGQGGKGVDDRQRPARLAGEGPSANGGGEPGRGAAKVPGGQGQLAGPLELFGGRRREPATRRGQSTPRRAGGRAVPEASPCTEFYDVG
jgi:hypothetical protein